MLGFVVGRTVQMVISLRVDCKLEVHYFQAEVNATVLAVNVKTWFVLLRYVVTNYSFAWFQDGFHAAVTLPMPPVLQFANVVFEQLLRNRLGQLANCLVVLSHRHAAWRS